LVADICQQYLLLSCVFCRPATSAQLDGDTGGIPGGGDVGGGGPAGGAQSTSSDATHAVPAMIAGKFGL
tara:strand:+ start:27 stop:233 length:207 start_codon:yes stop_codon:yes gene_type:complete